MSEKLDLTETLEDGPYDDVGSWTLGEVLDELGSGAAHDDLGSGVEDLGTSVLYDGRSSTMTSEARPATMTLEPRPSTTSSEPRSSTTTSELQLFMTRGRGMAVGATHGLGVSSRGEGSPDSPRGVTLHAVMRFRIGTQRYKSIRSTSCATCSRCAYGRRASARTHAKGVRDRVGSSGRHFQTRPMVPWPHLL